MEALFPCLLMRIHQFFKVRADWIYSLWSLLMYVCVYLLTTNIKNTLFRISIHDHDEKSMQD